MAIRLTTTLKNTKNNVVILDILLSNTFFLYFTYHVHDMKNNKIDIYSQSELFSSNFYLFIFGKRLTIKKNAIISVV